MEAEQRTDQIHQQKKESDSLLDIYERIRRLSLQHAEDLQTAFAESLTIAAGRAYWESQQADHGVSFPLPEPPNANRPPLTDQTQEVAAQLGKVIAPMPVLDAAYHIGLVYTTSLPPAYRARNGVYYTPPALANRVLDQADAAGVDWKTARIIDPACGGSAFLVPAALRLLDALRGTDPAIAQQNLKARLHVWEIDGFAAWLSRVFVEIACLPPSAATGHLVHPTIVAHDSLQAEIPGDGYDLVAGNPPFGRGRLSGQLRERFTRSLYGHANMYGVFTDLAVKLARAGGLVSFLTPASFLAGEYFKNLRALLWSEAPPAFVDLGRVTSRCFRRSPSGNVLATYRRGGRRRQASVSLVHPLPGGKVTIESAGRFALPSVCSEPWILPRSTRHKPLTRSMRSMPHRLADWGYERFRTTLCSAAAAAPTSGTSPASGPRRRDPHRQLRDRHG
jgi:adenine-specific DNA-methyltransferase